MKWRSAATCTDSVVGLICAMFSQSVTQRKKKKMGEGRNKNAVLRSIPLAFASRVLCPRSVSMQYQSPRYEGDVTKCYEQLVRCRKDVRASLSRETLRQAYIHFFGDLQRRTEVSLVRDVQTNARGLRSLVGQNVSYITSPGRSLRCSAGMIKL